MKGDGVVWAVVLSDEVCGVLVEVSTVLVDVSTVLVDVCPVLVDVCGGNVVCVVCVLVDSVVVDIGCGDKKKGKNASQTRNSSYKIKRACISLQGEASQLPY